MSDYDVNWEALRIALKSDRQIYGRLSADANHGTEGNAIRDRYQAMTEQVNKTLRSMDVIESAASPSVPGLAEHTAPGIPVQVKPSKPCREHGNPECFCDHDAALAEHTAAAQEKIIEASR